MSWSLSFRESQLIFLILCQKLELGRLKLGVPISQVSYNLVTSKPRVLKLLLMKSTALYLDS
jgi:hypothetical protein